MTDHITAAEAHKQLNELARDIQKANRCSRRWGLIEARREHNYRLARATEWASAKLGPEKKTAAEIGEIVNARTAVFRERRQVARVLANAEHEREKSLRQHMSAFQTTMNAARSEIEFHRQAGGDPREEDEVPF